MKKEIVKIVKSELKMTQNASYRAELEAILEFSKSIDDSFEDNMALYRKAKAVCSDTSPRELLYLAKEEYVKSVSND